MEVVLDPLLDPFFGAKLPPEFPDPDTRPTVFRLVFPIVITYKLDDDYSEEEFPESQCSNECFYDRHYYITTSPSVDPERDYFYTYTKHSASLNMIFVTRIENKLKVPERMITGRVPLVAHRPSTAFRYIDDKLRGFACSKCSAIIDLSDVGMDSTNPLCLLCTMNTTIPTDSKCADCPDLGVQTKKPSTFALLKDSTEIPANC